MCVEPKTSLPLTAFELFVLRDALGDRAERLRNRIFYAECDGLVPMDCLRNQLKACEDLLKLAETL